MRGKVLLHRHFHDKLGITPACAGKSGCRESAEKPSEDHPRVCGEKVFAPARSHTNTGSPPRVRGKDHDDDRRKRNVRITPACAGKRCRSSNRFSANQDHPRVCGEKSSTLIITSGATGSPPRVRGKESTPATAR